MKEITFYINKQSWISASDGLNFSFIPSIIRRRMSLFDKYTFYNLYKCFSDDIQNIVFSSKSGEVEKLIKIISQYSNEGEVSPATFSGSVHNYSVGLFLQNMKKSIPYTALSATDNSITAGLLAAVISKYDNNIFCYSNINGKEIFSMALRITKKPTAGSQEFRIILKSNPDYSYGNYNDFADLFSGRLNSIDTALYKLERINNVK